MPIYKFSDIVINSTAKKKPVDDDKRFYIGLEHLSPDTFLVEKYGSDTAPKGEKLLMKKGDVLFGKRRAYQKKVGIAPCDGIFSAHGMVLRPKEEVIDKNFFPFFIKSDYFLDKAIEISVGSLSPTINWGDLKELHFNLPSLEKQKELADILWSLENAKESYRTLIRSSALLIEAKFKEVSNNGIEKKINEVCGGQHSALLINKLQDNEGSFPLYGANGIVKNIDFYEFDNDYLSIIKWGAGVGRVQIHKGKSSIVGTMQGIIPNKNIDIIWLKYCLEYQRLGEAAGSTTVPNIYFKDYGQNKILVPSYDNQKSFSNFANDIENLRNESLKHLNETIDLQKRILKSILEEEE